MVKQTTRCYICIAAAHTGERPERCFGLSEGFLKGLQTSSPTFVTIYSHSARTYMFNSSSPARFWFLKQAHPEIILCTQKHCNHVEIYQHLFFDCRRKYTASEELFLLWTTLFQLDLSGRTLRVYYFLPPRHMEAIQGGFRGFLVRTG